ncbi:MAG: hypothetical protein IKN74_00205 [Clostridia bacterium]|nr:hypothetical protein [Clostridia bacterium]
MIDFLNKEDMNKLLDEIKDNFKSKKSTFEKAVKLDIDEWEYETSLEDVLGTIDSFKEKEYLLKKSKKEIVTGHGKVAILNSFNPISNLKAILSLIRTGNKPSLFVDEKILATNKIIVEIINNALDNFKVKLAKEYKVELIEINKVEDFISYENKFNLALFIGSFYEYQKFIKRINIKSIFVSFGEISIYVDAQEEFEKILADISKFAYNNEIKIKYYSGEVKEAIKEINDMQNISKTVAIFTKNIDQAFEFVEDIKSENIFINKDPLKDLSIDINEENLVIRKRIIL